MTESVREAASEYAEACRQANQRLRRCGEFLNRNLRSEAIQLSEAEPDLLEAVSTLDFAGRENWDSVVSLYNLSAVEPLLMEVAEALNEAYALQEPVEEAARQASLPGAVAGSAQAAAGRLVEARRAGPDDRQLGDGRQRDGTGPAPRDGGRSPRRGQAGRCPRHERDRRRARAGEVDRRSRNNSRRQSPSPLGDHAAGRAAQVEIVAAALQTALAESALERAHQLKTQWDDLQEAADLRTASIPFPSALNRRSAGWRKKTRKRRRGKSWRRPSPRSGSSSEMSATPRDALEHSRAALLRIDPTIPPPLEERFLERVQRIERQEKFRRLAIIGASVASVLVLAGLSALLVRRSLQNAEVSRLANALSQSVAEGKLVQARDFANEHVDLAGDGHWETAVKNLTDAEDQEKLRGRLLGPTRLRRQSRRLLQSARPSSTKRRGSPERRMKNRRRSD